MFLVRCSLCEAVEVDAADDFDQFWVESDGVGVDEGEVVGDRDVVGRDKLCQCR